MDTPPRISWARRYVLWGTVTFLGALLGIGAMVFAVLWSASQTSIAKSFAAPGEIVYDATTTDPVTIWNEIQVVTFGRAPIPPGVARPPEGLKVRVTEQSTGNTVSLQTAPKLVERFNSVVRLSIYQFTPDAPGKYTVTATGPSCTLAVGGDARKAMGGVAAGLCSGCFGAAIVVLGVVMLIVTGVRHSGSKGPRPHPPQPPT